LCDAAKRGGTRILATSWEPPENNGKFLTSHGVDPQAVLSEGESGIVISGTPMLVLAGRDGTVLKTWRGKLNTAAEEEVLRASGPSH